jgi:hypothetical protein
VEKDLQADAPQSAPSLSSDQLGQIATNIINGTQPSSTSATASGNLNSLATATGVNPNILLQQLSSGQDLTQLLDSPSQTSYGSSIADSITGGVAVDEYA